MKKTPAPGFHYLDKMRTILHLDMDQFYAAVEIRDNPALCGKPVIIGADPKGGKGRGVVSTASYEARKFGVRSALPISTAYKLCPQGVFLQGDMDKYCRVSDQIHAIFYRFTPLVEALSLDEAYLDVTQSRLLFGDGVQIAKRLKKEIRDETGLSCSVGVASNRLLAKIGSDLNKPDGLTVVEPGQEKEFLRPLPVSRLWGVGPKGESALADLGLKKVGDIQDYPLETLAARLGNWAQDLKNLADGGESGEVQPGQQAKSVGRERTFEEDTNSLILLKATLAELAQDVAARLRRHQWLCGLVTLKLRWEGFETLTRQKGLSPASSHGADLFHSAWELFEGASPDKARKVRLIGLTSGNLTAGEGGGQMELLASPLRARAIDAAMDRLNEKFGEGTVLPARLLAGKTAGTKRGKKP